MEKNFYTPMEEVLIKGTKEVCEAATETKQKLNELIALDLWLLRMEEAQGLMDGLEVELW